MNVGLGEYAENLLIDGIDLVVVGEGGRLKIGSDVILEVSRLVKRITPSVVTWTLGVTLCPMKVYFVGLLRAEKYVRAML